MSDIVLLPKETIDLIAAGEVAERPSSVVKELIENSIDAGADSVAVEIKDGGLKLIRVSDNGCGIDKDSLPLAFTAHATSKIRNIDDLDRLSTFGFRGEALSSISAVSKCEVITKESDNLVGYRYVLDGGKEIELSEVGAPNGTTFLVRDIFYNTPARLKFLKTNTTEGSYVTEVVENAALSHPEVAISYISNGRNVLNTSGKGDLSECIYRVFGKDAYDNILKINATNELLSLSGFICKSNYVKSNRSYEKFFVNTRPVKSNVLQKALEDGYSAYLMNHQFPFAVLFIDIDPSMVDVNVHPSKAEVRFNDEKEVYDLIHDAIKSALHEKEMIPDIKLDKISKQVSTDSISLVKEIDEQSHKSLNEVNENNESVHETISLDEESNEQSIKSISLVSERYAQPFETARVLREKQEYFNEAEIIKESKQLDLFEERLLSKDIKDEYHIIGQLFDTYYMVQYKDTVLMIDQHAAHEKVLFERFYKQISNGNVVSQLCSPSIICTLNGKEEATLLQNMDSFNQIGFEIEHFGGREYAIKAVPETLNGINSENLFLEILSDLSDNGVLKTVQSVYDRVATMACKAAVKGNMKLSLIEAEALIYELLELDNPYHCPHGRPTIITLTKEEIEKMFKRIV